MPRLHPVDGHEGKGALNSLVLVPHYCLPGFNTYALSKVDNCDEAIQYYSSLDHFNLPVPYDVLQSDIDSNINAVFDIVNLKTQWNRENNIILQQCRRKINFSSLNDLKSKLNNKNTKNLTIPYSLTNLSLHLSNNPDQYFDSEYNWYFKNTIEKFQINGQWYLACSRGQNLDHLGILSVTNKKFETVEIKEVKCLKNPIFDIKYSNSNELMVRQKTKLFIFLNNSDTETLVNNSSIYDNCDLPLVDADISINNFCTADVKHTIKLWKDRNCVQDKYFEVEYDQTDSFMHLSYLQNQTDVIAIINRQKLYLVDSRTEISKPCATYNPNTILEHCEELCALKSSNLNTHSFHVASNHSVLTLDNRMGFVHKSYHMLSNPPSLITTHCYENSLEPNELLILGNQCGESLIQFSYTTFQDDFLLCQNTVSSIPKPLDALHNVRRQGHCFDPILFNRFSRCLVGATVFGEHYEDLRLFSINSTGDVFVQKINNNTSIDVTEFKNKVKIKSQTVPKLNYSSLVNMSKLWTLEIPEKRKENIKKKNVWKISKQNVTSYVDHLAPLILSPWDIDDLSEWESEDEINDTSNADSDCDYNTKVHYWFDKNDLLLKSADLSQPSADKPTMTSPSQSTTITNAPPTSENDEDSSSGFTISLKSEDD